jgi:hypothetical protein
MNPQRELSEKTSKEESAKAPSKEGSTKGAEDPCL